MALRRITSDFACRFGSTYQQTLTKDLFKYVVARSCVTTADGFKYAESHEYVNPGGDTATVGISDFAQKELGEVVYVELPEVGAEVTKGETFGVVESVKAASDVYSPISGKVVEANAELSDNPGLVNTSPFADGWMIKVELSDKGEVDAMMDSDAYKKHCESL